MESAAVVASSAGAEHVAAGSMCAGAHMQQTHCVELEYKLLL